jgi:hypothetical protein
MPLVFAYYVPEKPIGDEDDRFEREQAFNRENPTAHIERPIEEMEDPGDWFLDELIDVELTAPDIETRKKVTEIMATGHYMHLHPSLQDKRQRKIEELQVSELAAEEVKAAFAAMRNRNQTPPTPADGDHMAE